MDGGKGEARRAQSRPQVSSDQTPRPLGAQGEPIRSGTPLPLLRKARFDATLSVVSDAYHRKLSAARSLQTRTAIGLVDGSHIVNARLDAIRQDTKGARALFLTHEAGSTTPYVVLFANSFVSKSEYSTFSLHQLIDALRVQERAMGLNTCDLWAVPTVVSLAAIAHLAELSDARAKHSEEEMAWLHSLLASLQNTEWLRIMPAVSGIDRLLAEDPSGDYPEMDLSSKDAYRQAVARLARTTSRSESEIVNTALKHASTRIGSQASERSHVGFYLCGAGKSELLSSLGLRRPRWRTVSAHTAFLTIATTLVLSAVALGVWIAIETAGNSLIATLAIAVFSPFMFGPVLFDVFNAGAMRVAGSAPTLRMSWIKKVTVEAKTLVVIPCLLRDTDDARLICKRLLMHRLKNRVEGVSYALLTDCVDGDQFSDARSEAIVDDVIARLKEMNASYGWSTGGFLLLHRNRVWCSQEGTWMGRGRKLGKLQDLNRHLHLGDQGLFARTFGDEQWLSNTRYVLTVDEDTELPWGSVARMVACIHHPLNRPRLAPDKSRLAHGHGVMQPSVSADAFSPLQNRYQDISTPGGGLKAYQSSAPNFYHDVLGAGSYTGKGIYDVACAYYLTDAVVCDREILSHDLVEGCLLGASSVPDIELFESAPQSFEEEVWRQNRWSRGDVQTVLWSTLGAGRAVHLGALSRFKLFGALAHHLFEVAAFVLLLLACAVPSGGLLFSSAAAALLLAPILRTLKRCARSVVYREGISHSEGWANVRRDLERCFVVFGTLPARSVIVSAGIVVACYRYIWSRRFLLQWRAFRDSQRHAPGDPSIRLILLNATAVACALLLSAFAGGMALWLAAALAGLWTAGPMYLRSLSRAIDVEQPKELRLRGLAWRTWCGVRAMLAASPTGLIPDSAEAEGFDERVSPTNIGMSLVSVISAEQLGFICRQTAVDLALSTLRATYRLERHQGHLFNWYDGESGARLTKTISSVDCGNFLASLLALRAWLRAAPEQDRWRRVAHWGAKLSASGTAAGTEIWHMAFRELLSAPTEGQSKAAQILEHLASGQNSGSDNSSLRVLAKECITAISPLDPMLAVSEALALVESLLEADVGAFLEQESGLLHVALEPEENTEVGALYDLLASEARLTVMVGIGRGDLDARAWRRLRRSKVSQAAPCLLSWSGSLFEHLMPEIFFRSPSKSLLAASHGNAVLAHQKANSVGAWGRAECGYQSPLGTLYGPHGVSEISLSGKPCHVDPIAPYASLLALPVDAAAVARNWDRLARLGVDSESGPYESLSTHPDGSLVLLRRHYAHHHGMILGAICNHLTGSLVELMMSDDEMCAASSLLKEVVPEECSIRTETF